MAGRSGFDTRPAAQVSDPQFLADRVRYRLTRLGVSPEGDRIHLGHLRADLARLDELVAQKQTANKRSLAAKKANETRGAAGRREASLKAWRTMKGETS